MEILNVGSAWNMIITHPFLLFTGVRLGSCRHLKLSFIVTLKLLVLAISLISDKADALPVDTNFTIPSPLPNWPTDGGFATGEIDLGGLQLRQVTSFQKIWTAYKGGPDDSGATFLEPSPIPDGFSMLGGYAQPNNRPLSGSILVAKTNATDELGEILKNPTDYTLIWSNDGGQAFFWLPIPPDGYKAVGLVVATSPEKPSVDKIRCVRSDFTADAEMDDWIWNQGINVYKLRPKTRGAGAQPLSAGTFVVENDAVVLSCLMNRNPNYQTGRLNRSQMEAVFRAYAPVIYFHPDESYLPSSVDWFFSNGALLYKKGEESNPVRVEPGGANLPKGGSGDGLYWLDLPAGDEAKDRVKKGDLQSAECYVHFKTILGGSYTDIQIWLFYPFNGHAVAKLGFIKRFSLGRIGEHVGDWEHVTLRVSNLDGVLHKVYFSQHSGGRWVDASLLQFESGNKFVWYASRNGHAGNYEEGLYLQGPGDGVGIRNDWARSDKVMDAGARFVVVAAEGEAEPPWLSYERKWGPTENYDAAGEVRKVKKLLPRKLKKAVEGLVKVVDEVFGKDGPTGPKLKTNWNGDEV